jgi:fructuronate reductase
MSPHQRRLSRSTLPAASAQPEVSAEGIGVVHLGIGAFARAHSLVFTSRAMARTGDLGWGCIGVTQRSRDVVDQLGPQDGLYSVLVRDGADSRLQVLDVVRELLFAGGQPAEVTARLADPRVRVVTLTVTEKGYRYELSEAGVEKTSVVGQLVRGLADRRRADAGPISLLSCDNLAGNGEVLRRAVLDYGDAVDPALASWIADTVAFPSSMVDRITPATTAADLDEAERLLGLRDEGVVVTEPFSQWVVEDAFTAGRPAWETAGVTLTDDVTPYEMMKLRLLNGSHSTMAYLGLLMGHTYVADAAGDPGLLAVVARLMRDDVEPGLPVPEGFDVRAYQDQLVSRWHNEAVRHRLAQIAMDGTQKIPNRWFAPIRERLAAGDSPVATTLGLAAWMRFVSARASDDGQSLPLDDPLDSAISVALQGKSSPEAVMSALFGLREVFGDLGDDPALRALVLGHLETLTRHGARAAASALA